MNDPMNDNVLDILIYLFENFLESDTAPQPSRDVLREELEHAGFAEASGSFEQHEGMAFEGRGQVVKRGFLAGAGHGEGRAEAEAQTVVARRAPKRPA